MQTPPPHDAPRPSRTWANRLSTVLFAAAIIFAGLAVYLYFTEESTPQGPTVPSPESGRNEFANVVEALRDGGLEGVEPGRYTATANQLDQPDQVVEIGETNLFVFIYPDADPAAAVAAREADAEDLDADTLVLTSRQADRPLNEDEESHIFEKSNVIVVLVGGDDDLVSTVEDAIGSLP